jgi:Putative NADPH-quinone reductase (modulator of drug activity B)
LVSESDEIVFVHPIWWSSVPAIMKNWIDHVLQAGFAFKYVNGKPVGLLATKSAVVLATSGGPAWLYTSFFSSFKLNWTKSILEFCGLYVKTFLVAGKMAFPDAEERFEKFLEKVKNL